VVASCAAANGEAAFLVEATGQKVEGKAPATEGWDKFTEVAVGTIEVKQAGEQTVSFRPRDGQSWKAINLRWVKLKKAGQ